MWKSSAPKLAHLFCRFCDERRARAHLARLAAVPRVAIALAVHAGAVRVAVLRTLDHQRAVVALKPRVAQAVARPAGAAGAAAVRALQLGLARVAGEPRRAHALPLLALAVAEALLVLALPRARLRRRAVVAHPAGVAEAAA